MKISREADYAIRCIIYMAQEPDTLHLITDIAASQEVPKSFLAKILQKLARAGIVSSTRGVNGGFTLSRRPADITLLDVIEAVQGPLALNACVIDRKACTRKEACSVHPVWMELREFLRGKMREYSFAGLPCGSGIPPDGARRSSPAPRAKGRVSCRPAHDAAAPPCGQNNAEEGKQRMQ
ncbi:MAG: Rrf2 family transcriptional regulator [Nitrospirales bacterium]|nr:Rrf2 family transcriptional regulator [Nitrospirales bacterium]